MSFFQTTSALSYETHGIMRHISSMDSPIIKCIAITICGSSSIAQNVEP
jgi:hypothetical protein